MYECGVIRRFRAKHALIGNFGSESKLHSHDYRVEMSIRGFSLDKDGFLLDLAKLDKDADETISSLLSHPSLNEVPGIKGKNPSAENLASCILELLAQRLDLGQLDGLTVTVWESESARASCISSVDDLRGKAQK